VLLSILARGILTRLVTRIYVDDEPANGTDPVLALVPAARRPTLLARHEGGGRYRFDIRMQGEDETVFFDV
jgi:protocatechuate 3,4-dioxygenase alpha subunit